MKLLVTGGAGFIGSHVAQAYLQRGDQVVIADNLSSGKRENLPAGARFVELDIRDRAGVDALFAAEGFALVNHHAAQIDVRKSVAETAPKSPLSPYGVTKLIGEHYLHCYRHAHGFQYAALRYGNVYGPRQDPHGEAGVVAIFSNALLQGKTPTVIETSVNALYQALAGFARHPHPAQSAPARLGELRRIALDVTKAKRLLGFVPRWSLRDGLQKTFEWVRGSKNRSSGTEFSPDRPL